MESWASLAVLADAMPWESGDRCADVVGRHLDFDALLVGLLNDEQPHNDEVLLSRGWSADQVRSWLDPQASGQKLIARSKRKGSVLIKAGDLIPGDPLRRTAHLLVQVVPADADLQSWWCLCLGRRSGPFSRLEQQMAALLLRYWQIGFDHIAEDHMGRLLIGHDDRLIHADPISQMRLLHHPNMLGALLANLHPVVQQRWPNLVDSQMHDFAVTAPGCEPDACWVRFRRNRATDAAHAEHWYLEARRLSPHDLPPIAVIEDERIAQALAFIHDRFDQAPSLAEVAHAVHVSPFHFHRLFTRAIGLSPKQYLHRKQLQVAKWLLRATREPIGSIAGKTGFASHGHFTSTFHRAIGVSPSQYREGEEPTTPTQNSPH